MFTKVCLIALACFAYTEAYELVSRAEWGARAPACTVSGLSVFPPSHVIVHHAESGPCFSKSECIPLVKSFQNYHIDSNGWCDIGYNFLVGEDGNVYEGRGWGKTGAHAPDFNSKSIGICVIGSFSSTAPNSAAQKAVQDLIANGVASGQISSNYKLAGHRQVTATDCPGNAFYNVITGWPHWTSSP